MQTEVRGHQSLPPAIEIIKGRSGDEINTTN